MAKRDTLRRSDTGRFVLYFAVCVFACSSVFAQAYGKPAIPPVQSPDNGNETTLKGCLVGDSDALRITTVDGHSYSLTGNTSALSQYVSKEISVQGTEDESTKPQPSFKVARIDEVFEEPNPKLSPSFSNSTNWQTSRNQAYGIKYRHPAGSPNVAASKPGSETNFAARDGAVSLGGFGISREAYPETNFAGGDFSLFVNPQLTNRESCEQFGVSESQFLFSQMAGDVKYVVMSKFAAANNTTRGRHYFHTFQNGLCYEVSLELDTFNTADLTNGGCTVPEIREADETRLIEPILAGVSFFHPAARIAPARNPQAVPRMTSLVASSQIAEDAANHSEITFSWSAEEADYVELTYSCTNPSDVESGGIRSLVIVEGDSNRFCENATRLRGSSTFHSYYSPNSSTSIDFGYFYHEDPTSIVVTVTPFSHARTYPASSKSLTISVDPHNPFPQGTPTETRNMTLLYSPGTEGTPNYRQGSSMTIAWTDARTQDNCVNLYLVQDDGKGGETYRFQINGQVGASCLKPVTGGSYAWTVSSTYLGSGFRILANVPGGASGTLGALFNIVGAQPGN